jgi:hypothetical protein
MHVGKQDICTVASNHSEISSIVLYHHTIRIDEPLSGTYGQIFLIYAWAFSIYVFLGFEVHHQVTPVNLLLLFWQPCDTLTSDPPLRPTYAQAGGTAANKQGNAMQHQLVIRSTLLFANQANEAILPLESPLGNQL